MLTARAINAAVFAPALLSEGKAEGSGRFSMSGIDPAKLCDAGAHRGQFHRAARHARQLRPVARGADQRQGSTAARTQFTEMSGQRRL